MNHEFTGAIETSESEAKSFSEVTAAQAQCARIFDGVQSKAYKASHGGYPDDHDPERRVHNPAEFGGRVIRTTCAEWKPGRDMPGGYDHV